MPALRLGLMLFLALVPWAQVHAHGAIAEAPDGALLPPANPNCMDQQQFLEDFKTRLGDSATTQADTELARLMHSFFEDQQQELAEVLEGDRATGRELARKWAECALGGFALSPMQEEIMVQGLSDAASAGDKRAMPLLATMLAIGQGVEQDYEKSFELFQRARDPHFRKQDMKEAYAMERVRGVSQRDARKRLAAYSFAFEQLFSYLADAHTRDLTGHIGESRFALSLNPCDSSGSVDAEKTDASFDQALLQRIVDEAVSRLPAVGVGCDVQSGATGMPGTLIRYL